MICREIRVSLAAYCNNELSEARNEEIARHLHTCSLCRQRLQSEQALTGALQRQAAIPAPSTGFEARVLNAATGRSSGAGKGWSHSVLGGAVAAALALGIGLGVMLDNRPSSPDAPVATSEPAVESDRDAPAAEIGQPTERTVRLAFRSGEALENVTLTLELPPHVELASWPGQHELSWKVSLDAGENVLSLPLKVLFPGTGELVARLDTGDRQKTFRAVIPETENAMPMKERPSS
ncbi:zf-HC2 domain-containing protein [Marinobacter sp. CAU 1620]|nr:zf-HC2 domain-containing protein [Marinobacter arenosus]